MTFYRVRECEMLCEGIEICCVCDNFKKKSTYKVTAKNKKMLEPVKPKAPIKFTSPERIKAAMQANTLRCKQLKKELASMKACIHKNSVNIDHALNNDILSIMENSGKNITPFVIILETTRDVQKKPKWSTMIVRYALSVAAKSTSAYEEIRNSGVLVLPSMRTLRDYKNVIPPKPGFQGEIMEDLISTTRGLKGNERYVTLLLDEMKIKQNLVFDKNSNMLVGFTDLGDPDLNFAVMDEGSIATHVMLFMIRAIASRFKYCLAYFGTDTVNGIQIFTLFWEAIFLLEKKCKLTVIATVADAATSNRAIFRMHSSFNDNRDNILHYTINLYAKERSIYFFSDAPHLMKTLRNCLFHSEFGKFNVEQEVYDLEPYTKGF